MIDRELSQHCAAIVALGFKCQNDKLGKFHFEFIFDDHYKDTMLDIIYRNHVWIIDDLVYGSADYVSLKQLIINEYFRWDEEE